MYMWINPLSTLPDRFIEKIFTPQTQEEHDKDRERGSLNNYHLFYDIFCCSW